MEKIYAVAFIDLQNYGFNAKTVELFPSKEMASMYIRKEYIAKCKEMGIEKPFECFEGEKIHYFDGGYAYIADYYYWDLFEREVHNEEIKLESKERARNIGKPKHYNFNNFYFIVNAIDMEKSLSQYLTDANYNYVLFDKGDVVKWGDKKPVIFADEMAIYNELNEDEIDKDGNLAPYLKVETEQDFIYHYCLDVLESWFKDKVKAIGEDDGVCHIVWLDTTFNNFLSNATTPDVLGIYVDNEGGGLSFLVSDKNDSCQVFFSISDFHINELIEFVKFIEREKEKLSEKE